MGWGTAVPALDLINKAEGQRTWTQKIYKQTHKFQNPLFQNYKHTKTLQTLLGLEDGQLFSVIAFVGDASFKTPMPENVTTGAGYLRYILRHQATVLSEARVAEILTQIEAQRLAPGFKTNRAHVAHLKQKHGKPAARPQATPTPSAASTPSATTDPTVPLCPKCGSQMVLRQVKKGERAGERFWGCSHYPRCRSMLPLHR